MDRHVPAASTLGRALLRLARSRATGTLHVGPRDDRRARARIALIDGRVRHVDLRDANRLGRFLSVKRSKGSADGRRIGDRWLAEGHITRPELSHALRRQMRHRMTTLFGWPRVRVSFRRHDSTGDPMSDVEPWDTRDLVLSALRSSLRPPPSMLTRLRAGRWRLTDDAARELEGAALYPDERAMLLPLRDGARGEDVLAMVGMSPRAERALVAWRSLGWITPIRHGDHALLLRKQRELRQRASHHQLLDLPANASPAEARRALRRLVRSVHPDRFDAALHEPSAKVVQALVDAEASLRSR